MKKTILLTALFLITSLPAFSEQVPEWSSLKPEVKRDLRSEGIDLKTYKNILSGKIETARRPLPAQKTGSHVASMGLVKGSAEQTYYEIANCPKIHEFMPHFTACKVVKPDFPIPANEKWTENSLSFGFPPLKVNVVIVTHVVNNPPYKLSWTKAKGDMKENEGYYKIINLSENYQVLIYDVISDVGRSVPSFIQTILTENDLPGVVEAIRKRVESKSKK